MSIYKRTLYLVKDPHNVRPPRLSDWAKTTTSLGTMAEPWTGAKVDMAAGAPVANTASTLDYATTNWGRVDEVVEIRRGWEKRVLGTSDDGGPALHGGALIPDGGA